MPPRSRADRRSAGSIPRTRSASDSKKSRSTRSTRSAGSKQKQPRRRKASRVNVIARERALLAVNGMRKGLSLTAAAKRAGTTRATIQRYAPRALVRTEDRRYHATRYDRYARTLNILTAQGIRAVTVQDSRTASRIAEHAAAVDHYLKTGKTDKLRPFRRKSFRAGKVGYPFLTDPKTLMRLGEAGHVSFEELYALRA